MTVERKESFDGCGCPQVLGEDLRLVEGQQNRMQRGSNVWNLPVAYDKLGVRYRQWRKAIETGEEQIPFTRD